jgi:Ca2+-transporting ATPase
VNSLEHERARPSRPRSPLAASHPRRLRLEIPGLFADPARAHRIERSLLALPGVRAARANARTGRVFVRVEHAAAEAQAAALAEADPACPPPPSAGRLLASAARKLIGAARATAAAVRRERTGPDLTPPPVEPFHARPVAAVCRDLGVDPALGLPPQAVAARLAAHGRNVLAGIEPRSLAAVVAGQILNVPTAILGGSASLALALGDALEALAIGGVLLTNLVIGTFTERRAEELLRAFGELRVGRARVLRGGRELTVDAADLVPGDVLALRAGDGVTADARVVAGEDLCADESTLTGESDPAEKSADAVSEEAPVADRSSMVFAGTVVASGEGRAVVVATGERTQLGAIRRALAAAGDRGAPLERQLDALGKRLALLSIGAAAAVIPLGLLRGRDARELAETAVALGVAAIPEGIPTAGTTALALASRRLLRRGIVIRRLAAAETLGAVSVVCADKTGTLTRNQMRVEELFLPGPGAVTIDWSEAPRIQLRCARGEQLDPGAIGDLARVLALNADVEIGEDGAVRRGSGTERGLVELALGAGFPVAGARRRARRVGEQRRSAERSFMVTVHADPEMGRIELIKGAPEQVVERCAVPDAAALLDHNAAMAGRGLRVLACGWRHQPNGATSPYTFLGLVGLRDPPREGVREAIAALGRAGVRTTMVTGDQERTAQAVARELGIPEDAVYARVTPEDKLEVVRDQKARGHIVAMTGDGVNDGPALKAADVGIAMGQRGTDIARAVADVVLASDDLSAITEAVAEGRRLYDNVRRAIDYLVATNGSEVLVMILGALGKETPLTALQLLWLNMLTDVVPALALAVEPADPHVMDRPPRDPEAPLLDGASWRRLGRGSAEMAAVALGGYFLGALTGRSRAALTFSALVTAQLLHTGACRGPDPGPNPALSRALAGTAALQLGAVALGPVRAALGLGATPLPSLALAAALGSLPALARGARADSIVVERSR